MGKKKPHLRNSEHHTEFDIDSDVAYTKKYPQQDGVKVYKTEKGYEIAYQERLAQSEKKFFATKKDAEKYLKSIGRK